MTSWHSLLACAQADVTIERITSLAATTGTEPLTVDFKEKADTRIAECVASMANAQGGLVLVGITDIDREIVGVKAETLAHVADTLTTRLDPADWLPEMFEVPVGEHRPDRYVLVIRIKPGNAPRPIMVQRSKRDGGDDIFWIPVRRPGGTRQATRAEMSALFADEPRMRNAQGGSWDIEAPQIPSGPDGTPDPAIDMILKTGLIITPGPACPGRPLSEAVIANLAAALDRSPLADNLLDVAGLPALMGRERAAAFHGTQRQGRPNTSGTVTLVWQFAHGEISPFQMTVRVVAPDQYGHSHIQTLNFSIEITSRLTAWQSLPDAPLPMPPGTLRRLETQEWETLLQAIIATLTSPDITAAIADLADIDSILVPPPRSLHIVSGQEIAGFLPPLQAIPGATGSRGAHLRADPALSLHDPDDRATQATRWLRQIAADAGLAGMERLTSRPSAPH